MMSIKTLFAQNPDIQHLLQGIEMYHSTQINAVNPETLNHSGQIQQIFSEFPGELQKWQHSLAILVPGSIDVNVLADTSTHLHQAIKLMSELFGGTRIWVEIGTYISKAMNLVVEQNVWVKSHMDESSLCRHFLTVFDFVGKMQDALRQEAMLLEVDGVMYCLNYCDSLLQPTRLGSV
jgi:hypothetical protein